MVRFHMSAYRGGRPVLSSVAWLLALMPLVIPPAAQGQSPHGSGLNTLAGTVRDTAGHTVAAATVSLLGADGAVVLAAHTESDGKYSFSALGPGSYAVRAEKTGYGAVTSEALVVGRNEAKLVDLALRPPAQTSSLGAPEFSDEPGFTVAGVTDASSFGGHGSNTMSRASEALAKDTVSLGEKSPPASPASSSEEKKLRQAAERDPRDFNANYRLGHFLLSGVSPRAAVPYLERASQLDPENETASFDLAKAYAGSGEYDRAHMIVQALLARQEKAEFHHLLGDVEERLGKPLDAVREFQRAAQMEPSEGNFFDWGAELLLHRAPGPAIEVFTKGNRLFPRSVRMLTGLGAAWYAQGYFEQAAQRFCEASDLDPKDPHPYMFLGKLLSVDGAQPDVLVGRLARFARLQPENAMANFYYAVGLWKQRKGPKNTVVATQVEALLEKAVGLDPRLGAAYMELGIVYSERGDIPQAIAAFQKAVAANPELEEAHYRLARAYVTAGKKAEAERELELYRQTSKKKADQTEHERHDVQQFVYTLRDPAPRPQQP
jgi:tetratricopeptide (TPR) repeat protein